MPGKPNSTTENWQETHASCCRPSVSSSLETSEKKSSVNLELLWEVLFTRLQTLVQTMSTPSHRSTSRQKNDNFAYQSSTKKKRLPLHSLTTDSLLFWSSHSRDSIRCNLIPRQGVFDLWLSIIYLSNQNVNYEIHSPKAQYECCVPLPITSQPFQRLGEKNYEV